MAVRFCGGCLSVLLLVAMPSYAGEAATKKSSAGTAPASELVDVSDVAAVAASDLEAIESQARRRPLDGPANPDPRLNTLRFRDHLSPSTWLRNIKSLPLVTFWQSNRMSIFLGLNSKGLPGLHLQQTEPEEYEAVTAIRLDDPLPDLPVRSLALASR